MVEERERQSSAGARRQEPGPFEDTVVVIDRGILDQKNGGLLGLSAVSLNDPIVGRQYLEAGGSDVGCPADLSTCVPPLDFGCGPGSNCAPDASCGPGTGCPTTDTLCLPKAAECDCGPDADCDCVPDDGCNGPDDGCDGGDGNGGDGGD